MTVAKKTTKKIPFEKAMSELEDIVSKLEAGEISLEDSLKHFERGIELTRNCQTALEEAEQKVQILTQSKAQNVLMDLDPPDTEE